MITVSNDYKSKIYAESRQFDSRFTFNVPGFISNQTYYDDRIMEINVHEENTPLSDVVPSNEMSIKLDNRDGTFNFLTYNNMPTILASRPTMFAEVGLVLIDTPTQILTNNYVDKVAGSLTENPHKFMFRNASNITDAPSLFTTEHTQANYDNIKVLDGTTSSNSTSVSGSYAKSLVSFNMFQILERQYGISVWDGATTTTQKIARVVALLNGITINCTCRGSNPSGNNVSMQMATGYASNGTGTPTWSSPAVSHTSSSNALLTITPSTLTGKIDSNGFVHFQVYSATPSDGVTASNNRIDYVELLTDFKDVYVNEWIPLGYSFLDNWTSDYELQTVTLFGHDWFEQLINIPFNPATYSNMTNLITAIMTTAGITNYSIDSSIGANFTTPKTVPEITNCRALLQLIGIVTLCAVYQDRTGKLVIKPYPSLQNNGMYTTFATTNTGGQRGIWQYAGNGGNVPYTPYEEVNDDGGNRHIQLKDMYELPRVSLEKSIYKLVVNIYNSSGTGAITSTNTYTNATIGGANGISFEMNNYLIYTNTEAQNVANYFFSESNYNVEYTSSWRQNPSIECGDLVLFDDGMPVDGVPGTTSQKTARIYKQDFNYDGALSGTTEGRGGL